MRKREFEPNKSPPHGIDRCARISWADECGGYKLNTFLGRYKQ